MKEEQIANLDAVLHMRNAEINK
jgi:hypothetical protein